MQIPWSAWFRRRRPAHVEPAPAIVDPRTEMLPLLDGQQGRTYYEVAELWAVERLRAQRLVADLAGNADPVVAARDFPDHWACEFGVWARFVDAGQQQPILDDLRMWHMHWHVLLREIIERAWQGDLAPARQAASRRSGPWHLAGRRIDRLIESMWAA